MLEVNKIYNADCLELMKEIEDKSIDAIICDLPYGTTACSWDVVIPFDKLWEQYKRIRKDNTPIVLFGSEPFSTYLRMSNIKEYKYDLIWVKTKASGHLVADKQPMKRYENISVFGNGQILYNFQLEAKNKKNIRNPNKKYKLNTSLYSQEEIILFNQYRKIPLDKKYPDNVLEFQSVGNFKRIHPTQKPSALLEYLIKTYSNEGDLILDNCSGSGTLAIACHNTRRNFICIEKDKDYYEKSVERLRNAQAQLKLF